MTLKQIQQLFADAECVRLYAKLLAKNDNSKQQVYFGSGFEAVNIIPSDKIRADRKDKLRPKFKAKVDFGWLNKTGSIASAPGAQLILYPQYPEVRFSGFLRGCVRRPAQLMTNRKSGRVLFLGITRDEKIVGLVVGASSAAGRQFRKLTKLSTTGVFAILEIPNVLSESKARAVLLRELTRITNKGWIRSKQMGANRKTRPCNAPQCGGFTLEAELGIVKNSKSEPDFHGWEVKQHGVQNLDRPERGKITLMTPEPTGGYYKEKGPIAFVSKFGHTNKKGRPGRQDFTGVHRCGLTNTQTKLTLRLYGYDRAKNKILKVEGAVRLVDHKGMVAASWSFSRLMSHWKRKHARAAYVPSLLQKQPFRRYKYGRRIRLAETTDFLLFVRAVADQIVFYDPGIKVETSTGKAVPKLRSQFRVSSRDIAFLYQNVKPVDL